MCSVIILRRPNHNWPLILAGNRDEMVGRPWLPPARHWSDRPDICGGLDQLAEGSWLAMNDFGVVAVILNRMKSLGPEAGKRSRGELVLEALDHADADEAASAISKIEPTSYRPFNMIIADNRDAFWLRHDGQNVQPLPVPEGISMITAMELNDDNCPRIHKFLPFFQSAPHPQPDIKDFTTWQNLLAKPGLVFQMDNGFGTRSGAIIALPAPSYRNEKSIFLFSDTALGQSPWREIPHYHPFPKAGDQVAADTPPLERYGYGDFQNK